MTGGQSQIKDGRSGRSSIDDEWHTSSSSQIILAFVLQEEYLPVK